MIKIPLSASTYITGKYANRHGLIAGATGTGKTVTLMKMAEEFSRAGVPVFVADVKGDLSALATGTQPVKPWDVDGQTGHKFTITVPQFGADLLGRILDLSEPQQGAIEAACYRAPQTIAALEYTLREDAAGPATAAAIVRKISRFANNGGRRLTEGRPFDLSDMVKLNNGQGQINIMDAEDLIMSPEIYGTVMLWLLREVYERFPEAGDCDRPKFVMFIDEAHLLFSGAPPHLLRQIEQTVRLVRSKGVGIYFVTQSPDDLPAAVLGQLGHRIQHALRGATVRDQRAIKAAAETMPVNPSIDAAAAIGQLGIGEALVSVIDHRGVPAPCQRVRIDLPSCRLGALPESERLEKFGNHDYVKMSTAQQPMTLSDWGYGLLGLLMLFGSFAAIII